MTDERAYRSDKHPAYCTCVECEVRRNRRAAGNFFKRLLKWVGLARR